MKPRRLIIPLVVLILIVAAGLVLHAQDSKTNAAITHFNASLTHEAKDEYVDALKEMEAIPADAKNDYAVLLRLGWVEYLNRKYDLSEKYYRQAVMASYTSIEALLGLTLPLAAKQDWAEVETCYQKVLSIDPENYTAQLRLGQIYLNRGDYSGAAGHLASVLEHYPANYEAVLSSAWNDYGLGRKDEARKLFERALMLSPGDTSAQRGLSSVK